jgi:hypothetical protein
MMRKKIIVALLLAVCVIISKMESVEPSDPDCYDQCSTGCVQPDSN